MSTAARCASQRKALASGCMEIPAGPLDGLREVRILQRLRRHQVDGTAEQRFERLLEIEVRTEQVGGTVVELDQAQREVVACDPGQSPEKKG